MFLILKKGTPCSPCQLPPAVPGKHQSFQPVRMKHPGCFTSMQILGLVLASGSCFQHWSKEQPVPELIPFHSLIVFDLWKDHVICPVLHWTAGLFLCFGSHDSCYPSHPEDWGRKRRGTLEQETSSLHTKFCPGKASCLVFHAVPLPCPTPNL